jgi:hypothetical protein
MKVKIEAEDRFEALRMIKSLDLVLALDDLRSWIRGLDKHGDSDTVSVDAVWDKINEVIEDRVGNLGELYE